MMISSSGSTLDLDRCGFFPLSLTSIRPCQSRAAKTLSFFRHPLNLKLAVSFRRSCGGFRRSISAFVPLSGDADKADGGQRRDEKALEGSQALAVDQLRKHLVFGLVIGIGAGGIVIAGGWVFTVAVTAAVFVASREYFELVRSRGIADGMTPPPRYVSRVCSVICALMPILTLYFGQMDVSVTSSAFIVAMALVLQRGNPRFAQLSSAIFGLFYCGYLPCFWVKLRCGLADPALNTSIWSHTTDNYQSKEDSGRGFCWSKWMHNYCNYSIKDFLLAKISTECFIFWSPQLCGISFWGPY